MLPTFNHTRGDSPFTPCSKCARELGWFAEPEINALRCPKCAGLISPEWLDAASARGEEHVCQYVVPTRVEMSRADKSVPASLSKLKRDEASTAAVLATYADDELRAECERRDGPNCVFMVRGEYLKAMRIERDEWKRLAEVAEATVAAKRREINGMLERLREAKDAQRAAEARNGYAIALSPLSSPPTPAEKERVQREYDAAVKKLFNEPPPAFTCEWIDSAGQTHRHAPTPHDNERGPGIADRNLKPDNAIDLATLADLLADDA